MPDDSFDVLHHGLAVVLLAVVVAKPHPQVLHIVFAHAEIEINEKFQFQNNKFSANLK